MTQLDSSPERTRAAGWRPRPTLAGTDYTSAAVWDEELAKVDPTPMFKLFR